MTRFAEHRLINPSTLTPASVLLSMCLAWWLAPVEMYAPTTSAPYLLLESCLAALFGGLVLFFETSWDAKP